MAVLTRNRPVPFNRLAIVAVAGLVAFMSLMQGILASTGYTSCNVHYEPNMNLAFTQLGIAGSAYLIFLIGALRLRKGWEKGKPAYIATVVALLVSASLLATVFIHTTSCAG